MEHIWNIYGNYMEHIWNIYRTFMETMLEYMEVSFSGFAAGVSTFLILLIFVASGHAGRELLLAEVVSHSGRDVTDL